MQYTRFGNTDIDVSRFSLGTMGFGGQHLDAAACDRVLGEAMDAGVNMVDTGDGYGESEAVLGRIIGARRGGLVLATKVFVDHTGDADVTRNSRRNILAGVEDSLRLLGLDYIDLYQLHHPDPETPIEETLEALSEVVKAGKVRYVGVSNHYAWQMALMLGRAEARGLARIVSAQLCYNVLDRPIEQEAAAFCLKLNVPVMAYSPLSGGLLSGRYSGGGALPAGSAIEGRFGGKLARMHETEAVRDILAGLRPLAEAQGLSMIQLSLLWLSAKPFVGTVLVGGTRSEHFRPAWEVTDRALPADVVAEIDALSERQVYKPHRNQPFADAPALREG